MGGWGGGAAVANKGPHYVSTANAQFLSENVPRNFILSSVF